MTTLDKASTAFLVVLFAFAGLDKVAHYHGFVTAIDSYRLLPIPMGSVLAPWIIAAELSIAVGLLLARWRRAAALQAAVLMTLLTIGLAGNELLGARGICGCWFSITMAQGGVHFLLNAIVIALSLLLWRSAAPVARSRPEEI